MPMSEAVAVPLVLVHELAVCCWCGSKFVRTETQAKNGSWTWAGWLCPNPPCFGKQFNHAMIVQIKGKGKVCRFVPLPRQVDAIEALSGPATYVLMGGAAGGSKSKGLREIA